MVTTAAFIESAFLWILDATLHASLLALLVGAVLLVARDRIAPRWRHALWLLVALRLCLAAAPPSPFSLAALLPRAGSAPAGSGPAEPAAVSVERAAPDAGTPAAPAAPAAALARPAGGDLPPAGGARASRSWAFWLGLAWLAGCAVAAARLLLGAARQRRELHGLEAVESPAARALLEECAGRLGLRRAPELLAGDRVAGPALAGLIRPRIILPRAFAEGAPPEELRHVLLHELAHLKRLDVAVAAALSALEALHWFNPLLRWAFARSREERELACDAAVLERSGEAGGRAYAATLLRLAEAASLAPRGAVGLHGARSLERRLRWIAGGRHGRGSPVLAALLLAGCAAAGLTDGGKAPGGERVPRIYDVEPLAKVEPEFGMPRLGVVVEETPKALPAPEDPEADRAKRRAKLEELAALLRKEVVPEAWAGGATVEPEGEGALRVTAPEEVHDAVRALLDRKLAERGLWVYLEYKLALLDAAALASLPPRLAGDLDAAARGKTLPARRVMADEADALVRARRAGGSPAVTSRPVVTAWNRQLSHIAVINQSAHIVDLKKAEADGKGEAQPVIGVLSLGFAVEQRAAVSEDRKRVALELQYEWADAKKPVQAVEVEGVPIAMPELAMCQGRATLDAPLGEWMLAGAFHARSDLGALLVKAEVVEPEAAGARREQE
ncbi:MAG: M56 family metallopeptidase [Planctomycetes bacterium]|nr:M56 family metallopeptidase [Planctomycetota bacterium]